MFQVVVQKNLISLEDINFGVGTSVQTRGKNQVTVTKINAANMPFDESRTLAEAFADAEEQIDYLQQNRDLLLAAVNVIALLQSLQVNINDLAAWLANGSHTLSAFQPYAQRVTHNEVLADNVNYTMLEDTVVDAGVTITLGVNTKLLVLKGTSYV